MSYKTTTTTWASTGSKTLTTTFQPTWVRITLGALFSGPETDTIHQSIGRCDGTNQTVNYFFADDTPLYQSGNSSTKIVSHWANVSGVVTEVVAGSFTSWSATNIIFNCTAGNANYQLFIEYGN